MNYTIIIYTEGVEAWRNGDRDERFDVEPVFDIQLFRDNRRVEFLRAWADQLANSKHDLCQILLDGIPEDQFTNEEYDVYSELETEMRTKYLQPAKDARAAEIKAEKERRDQAVLEQSRRVADLERAHKERQFEQLRRELGKP